MDHVKDIIDFANIPKLTKRESRLVMAADHIHQNPAHHKSSDVSYWPRGLIQCTLPHSNPGNVPAYARRSGDFYLLIEPGHRMDRKSGQIVSWGYPYGSYPRLCCSYFTLQAKRHRSPIITLGDSLSRFMAQLGLVPTGGRWGTITNLRKQILALVNSKLAFGYAGTEDVDAGGNQLFADKYVLWWNTGPADQTNLFPSYIELSQPLYEEIIEHAFPCDMRILRELKQSSLGLDLYAWGTYKVFNLKSASAVSWKSLHAQFGTGYSDVRNFRRVALKQLAIIKALYPDFKYTLERGRIVIWPSHTSVLPISSKQ